MNIHTACTCTHVSVHNTHVHIDKKTDIKLEGHAMGTGRPIITSVSSGCNHLPLIVRLQFLEQAGDKGLHFGGKAYECAWIQNDRNV